MASITLDMYQTLAIAVAALFLGSFLKKKIPVLERFCIPSPVVGGMVFSVVICILFVTNTAEITFTDTFREVCMVFFFCSVGFQANVKALKSGGKALVILIALVVVLIILQNVIAISLSGALGLDPLMGMCTGSIPMVGGHGTAGAFGPVLEDLGVSGATTIATAAATFGLIAGSLMGGPLANSLIRKKDLLKTAVDGDDSVLAEDEKAHKRAFANYAPAAFQLILAAGIGTIASWLLSMTGMKFPVYIGAMIIGAIIRNIGEMSGKIRIHMGEINDIGGIMLDLFLGIAMITLQLWLLADLALPFLTLLAAQTVFMFLYARFAVFNLLGRDYDAAVVCAGTCGFGMGATPNAMANMQAVCRKYRMSVKAFLIVPLVGSLFVDFINSLTVTFFINSI